MTEFEYSDLSSEDSFDGEPVLKRLKKKTTSNISKDLNLYYSNLFIDTLYLIDLFVKSKIFTYDLFLVYFDSVKFHQIYSSSKKNKKAQQTYLRSP